MFVSESSVTQQNKGKTLLLIILAVSMVTAFVQQSLSDGQIIVDAITVQALRDNRLGDPDTRNILIYLPPGYDSSDKAYPVIYFLHGFGGDERSLVGEVGEQLVTFLIDGMIGSGALKEMIIVMPDASNSYGGSFYLNSELTGNYEDYVAVELVDYIDGKYRTIPHREGRAVAGASMGGYGSMTLAMKHPQTYSAVASLSPPLGFEAVWAEMLPEALAENPDGMGGPNSEQYTSYIYALSAALSPNLDNPPFFVDLPFEYPSGKVIEEVRQRWLVSDPLTMLSNDSAPLMTMKGIYIDVGDEDLPGFKAAADAFHEELTAMGIQHTYHVYQGGHSDNPVVRAVDLLTFLSDLFPTTPTAVRYGDQLPVVWGAIKEME